MDMTEELEVNVHQRLAKQHVEDKRIHDASVSLLEALRIDPINLKSVNMLAKLYDENDLPQKSVDVLSQYHKASTKNKLNIIDVEFKNNRWESCLKRSEEALKENEEFLTNAEKLSLHFKAATSNHELGNVTCAIEHANKSLALESDFLPGLTLLARLFSANGDKIKASQCIGKSAAVEQRQGANSPRVSSLYLEAGVMAMQAKDSPLAHHYIDRGLQLNPLESELLEVKTQLFLDAGDLKGAKKTFLKKSAKSSSEAQAKRCLEYVKLLEKHNPKSQEIRDLCLEALALKPDSVECLSLLLGMAKENQNWQEVLDTLLKLSTLETSEKRKIRMLEQASDIAKGISSTELSRVLQCYFDNRHLSSALTQSMVLTFRELVATYDRNGQAKRIPDLYDWAIGQLLSLIHI